MQTLYPLCSVALQRPSGNEEEVDSHSADVEPSFEYELCIQQVLLQQIYRFLRAHISLALSVSQSVLHCQSSLCCSNLAYTLIHTSRMLALFKFALFFESGVQSAILM